MQKSIILSLLSFFYHITLAQDVFPPFLEETSPAKPDYSSASSWASFGDGKGFAYKVPRPLRSQTTGLVDSVDIFFIHPTIFTGEVKDTYYWNASLSNKKLNRKTDRSTIKMQASIFNAAGRVFAPRYRQAHLRSFRDAHKENGHKALLLAYQDIKDAFLWYMKHKNEGRPVIFAAHSQGALHLSFLLKEYYDKEEPEYDNLVAAYVVGWGVGKDQFAYLPACQDADQTNCFMTWRTYRKGIYPSWVQANDYCTNPLNWKTDTTYADYSENNGAVLMGFHTVRKSLFDAQIHEGLLWVGPPRILFSKLLQRDNYHIGDYNLFYVNTRINAIRRARNYVSRHN